jgi:hypothetical protein
VQNCLTQSVGIPYKAGEDIINPLTKRTIFSNALKLNEPFKLHDYFKLKIKQQWFLAQPHPL